MPIPGDLEKRFYEVLASLISPSQRLGVAVSGGADSVTLLELLHRASPSLQLVILHVNHALRGDEATLDQAFVATLARDRNLPFETRTLPPDPEENLEQSARDLRYAFFREARQRYSLDFIALGHTRSDQAETVLFRLLRGAGGAGLAAMRPAADSLIRPLLTFSRHEVRTLAADLDLQWREDSSNSDLHFARNQIRTHLLPQLARDWNPAIELTLAHIAQWAQAEEHYWAAEVLRLQQELVTPAYAGYILDVAALNALPLAAARRLIRRVIEFTRGDLRQIDFSHTERILQLATSSHGSGRVQIPGTDIFRSFEKLRFAPLGTYGGDRFFERSVSFPSEIHIPGAPFALLFQFQNANCPYNGNVDEVDQALVEEPLILRTWQPGDQYRRAARSSETKMKTLFQEARIPLWERRTWPVLTMNGRIVWSRTFGTAADFAVSATTRSVIAIYERAAN